VKDFAQLYANLDASTSTQRKCGHIVQFLKNADAADAAWAVFFLTGGRVRRVVSTALMRRAACEMAGVEDWLFEQSYQAVGDLAETIALLLPLPQEAHILDLGLAQCIEQRVLPLRGQDEDSVMQAVRNLWMQMSPQARFLFVKWVGGGLRVGVSRALVIRALSQHTGLDARILSQRMIAFAQITQPQASDWQALVAPIEETSGEKARDLLPYPFFLAHPLQGDVCDVGHASGWMAEWKYDGIRAQIVRRNGAVNIWSRGEELLNDTFPELVEMALQWPHDVVVDGEILVMHAHDHPQGGKPAPFAHLQVRLGRKRVDAKLRQTHPVVFMSYDLLEREGSDVRQSQQWQRRVWLEEFVSMSNSSEEPLLLAPVISFSDWNQLTEQRSRSRELGVEGLMLKRRDSFYGVGRTRNEGLWLKWKIEAMSIDAVLVYAQAGHGRRASLYTDYTFAVWDRTPTAQECERLTQLLKQSPTVTDPELPQLVTFAKAYSGLTDEEFRRVDKGIRQHMLEKFGPVRRVVPFLVFEIGFEGIATSGRHKSGVAVRFPRMLRIRDDKPLEQASTLADLKALLGVNA
jgi:DNA ligase-1